MGRLMRNVGRATTTSDDDKDDDDNERDGGTTSGSISPPGGGGGVGGISRRDDCILNGVRFTSLPWIEWQIVREWRTRTYEWMDWGRKGRALLSKKKGKNDDGFPSRRSSPSS